MVLRVYISYSMQNKYLVDTLYSILNQSGVEVVTNWHEYYESNINMFESVKSKISICDIAVFFIAQRDTKRSQLFEEITVAKTLGKSIVPILEPGIPIPPELAQYQYIVIDRARPERTLEQIRNFTVHMKSKKDKNSVLGLILLSGAIALLVSALKDDEED